MARWRIRPLFELQAAFVQASSSLDFSLNPRDTLQRLSRYPFTIHDIVYLFHIVLAIFWITIMAYPPFPYKLLIPVLYSICLLVPLTSQFFVPATPVFAWLLTYYSSRFIPESWRPRISVSTLPTLETVLYGTNISDILTRFTHPILDIVAWLPYGVGHFVVPFIVATFLWLFAPNPALRLWAKTFGYLNLFGVACQIVFPCAAPWYELIHGLTPANYAMKGSPGGLARIDRLFHSQAYTIGFSNAPVVFGAFPSLHSACATIEALFLSHFFPDYKVYAWTYVIILYWATMYLTHHYLIDVVGGACFAVACFYLYLPDDLRELPRQPRNKHELYGLSAPIRRAHSPGLDSDLASDDEHDTDIPFRSPRPPITPDSAAPLVKENGTTTAKSHRHTASIASLIGADNQIGEGLMTTSAVPPIGNRGFGKAKDTPPFNNKP